VVVDRTSERHREEVERRFIANASHELRTPLSAIAAAVEVLESGAKDDPVARDAFLADVRREATRLGRLTDTLLTVARLGTGELRARHEPVEVGDAARHVGELLAPLADAAHVSLVAAGDCEVLADADLLEQALMGLVANAIKHTPAGGRVDILVTQTRQASRVVIADTGTGIPPQELARVFDRFWRADDSRSDGGFGLGLGICREFIEAMGGSLELESQVGRGTVATIMLEPAAVPAAAR
jgi:two-component system phosphate regulon sensor histidine kinase PhoR